MDIKQPLILDLLLETHIGLERQGPGSQEAIEKALEFIKPLDRFSKIADLGCGTGGQTMFLAQYLLGTIIGLDLFPIFIDVFNMKSQNLNYGERVKGMVGSMDELPFEQNSLDLIWSEGAIDNIGFRNGMSHWHDFLKKGGFVAVSCPSWLTTVHPIEVERFWTNAGSHLDNVSTNIEIMQSCGYQFIASFALPETCWVDHYFIPRKEAIQKLQEKYVGNANMIEYAEQNRYEMELYSKYHQHYGYVFYIGKAI